MEGLPSIGPPVVTDTGATRERTRKADVEDDKQKVTKVAKTALGQRPSCPPPAPKKGEKIRWNRFMKAWVIVTAKEPSVRKTGDVVLAFVGGQEVYPDRNGVINPQ